MDGSYTHLVGRVGTPLEKKTLDSGSTLKEFRLAVDGPYDAATKSRGETEWYTVTIWSPLADHVKFGKGARVWVAGQVSTWRGDSGERKKITAREVGLVDKIIPGITSTEDMYPEATKAKKSAPVPEGVTFDDEEGDW
jgi:single-stranded DNA-binding protein